MKKIRVLLVDDSPEFLAAAQALLATVAQAECIAAVVSAKVALQKIPSLAPDLVLMDVMMPGMSGFEAIRPISALPGAPKVVLVTWHDGAEYRAAALKHGAHGLIFKNDFAIAVPELIACLARGDTTLSSWMAQ